MPAKKKLTKKKPAAKAAQPSSKKRPMPTKAKPAAKKAAPKAKAKPMAKKKKPTAKKPARRPFHEGGMIDMELDMLESMAMEAMMAARESKDPNVLEDIFAQLSMGINQVRDVNRGGNETTIPNPKPLPSNPNVSQQQEQAARRMNQAQFMRPQFPRRGTNPQPILPKDPPFKKDMPGYDPNAPAPPQKPTDTSGPLYDAPRDLSGLRDRANRMENNRNPQRTGPRYNVGRRGATPANFTAGPRRPQRIAPTAFDPATGRPLPSRPVPTPTPMGPRAGGAINPNPTRVPLNQPPMDRMPPRGAPDLRPNPPNTTDQFLGVGRYRRRNPNYVPPVNKKDQYIMAGHGRYPNPNYDPNYRPPVNTTSRYIMQGHRSIPNPNYRPPAVDTTTEFFRAGHGRYPNPNYVSPQDAGAIAAANRFRFSGPQITPDMQAAARQMQQGTNAGTTPRPMNKGGMVLRPEQYQRAAEIARSRNKRR